MVRSTSSAAPACWNISSTEVAPTGSPAPKACPLDDVRLHAPVDRPSKIIGIGLNYSDHAAETGADIPEKPIVFAKYPNTITGPGNAVRIPAITEQADYEAELAVVIGRSARHVEVDDALEYVFGYMNANDVSSRDLQFSEGGQWTRSKSLDTFAPIGPYLVSREDVPDPQDLSIKSDAQRRGHARRGRRGR